MSVSFMAPLPAFNVGPAAIDGVPDAVAGLSRSRVVMIVMDRFWRDTPAVAHLSAGLDAAGIAAVFYDGFSGEPKSADIVAIADMGRQADVDVVIGLGGGAALDAAKIASICITGGQDVEFYAYGANPLPEAVLPSILIPTTAGTGSEANGTAIFTTRAGKKGWIYGAALTARLAVLDPDLTASLPPAVAASCGMDAFVHAFESATNLHANPVSQSFSLLALRLICGALKRSVLVRDDADARRDMLLGSFYAGYAIANAGTAVAHNVSHALAGLHPVAHGHATALAFEQSLASVVSVPRPAMTQAAQACGVEVDALPAMVTMLMDEIGIERRLPDDFATVDEAALLAEMNAPENHPMRDATVPALTDDVMRDIAQRVLSLAKVGIVA